MGDPDSMDQDTRLRLAQMALGLNIDGPISGAESLIRTTWPKASAALREAYAAGAKAEREGLSKSIENAIKFAGEEGARRERERCKRDACGYCNGHFPQFERTPVGPNSAGNYVHERRDGVLLPGALCRSTGIFARERWLAIRARGTT